MGGIIAGLILFGVGATVGIIIGSYVLWIRDGGHRYDLFWEEDDWDE